MVIGKFCNREVVFATREMGLPQATQLLCNYHVDSLVVVDDVCGKRMPVIILTDRHIVIEEISQSPDFNAFTVDDIMSPQLFSVQEVRMSWKLFGKCAQKKFAAYPLLTRKARTDEMIADRFKMNQQSFCNSRSQTTLS